MKSDFFCYIFNLSFSILVTSTEKLSPITSLLLFNLYLTGRVVVGGGGHLLSVLCKSQGLLYGICVGWDPATVKCKYVDLCLCYKLHGIHNWILSFILYDIIVYWYNCVEALCYILVTVVDVLFSFLAAVTHLFHPVFREKYMNLCFYLHISVLSACVCSILQYEVNWFTNPNYICSFLSVYK